MILIALYQVHAVAASLESCSPSFSIPSAKSASIVSRELHDAVRLEQSIYPLLTSKSHNAPDEKQRGEVYTRLTLRQPPSMLLRFSLELVA